MIVDALAGGVLTHRTVWDNAGAFAGLKLLYDVLFALGTIAFGLGAPAVFASEMKATPSIMSLSLLWVGTSWALRACCRDCYIS